MTAGAIPPLVAMLGEGGADEVKEAAATALYNLSRSERYFNESTEFEFHDDTIVAIAAEGAIPPLVIMLSAETDHIKERAALLLGNILSNTAYKVDIARAGAIPPLVFMLRVGETTKSACTALWRLSTNNDENKAAIAREEHAIRYLVQILSSEEEYFDAASAARVLEELSTNNDIRVKVVQEGAIPPLVAMLSPGFGNVSMFAIKALRNILSDNNNKMAIEQEGAIPLLAAKLNQRRILDDVKEAAADLLRILQSDTVHLLPN